MAENCFKFYHETAIHSVTQIPDYPIIDKNTNSVLPQSNSYLNVIIDYDFIYIYISITNYKTTERECNFLCIFINK